MLLTADMLGRPLPAIPEGFKGPLALYIFDDITGLPILEDAMQIYPFLVPAAEWLDSWRASFCDTVQWFLPIATFATNAVTFAGLVSDGFTSSAQAAISNVEAMSTWLTPAPSAQDAQMGKKIQQILNQRDPARNLSGTETCISESGHEVLRGTKQSVADYKERMATNARNSVRISYAQIP